ncbi:unnamed protein product [Protopolystoma xenopodis]|uniref:ATP-dependent RNA helicase Ski2/MTR4 C-terminal domain-containing protein n=1 Tax=Protopolystoma xenopodis TaxID=117903 RepID=A0A3S5CNN3_9PLAT|nr:unnamed protein product [Protopolystoma xenopodis]
MFYKAKAFEERLHHHWLHDDPRLESLLAALSRKSKIKRRLAILQTQLSRRLSLIQLDELASRKRVLRRLGFINEHDVVELKGRVACEITSADELVLTELLFDGVFNRLTPAQVAALLSCFVFDERTSEMPQLMPQLADALDSLKVGLFLIKNLYFDVTYLVLSG